MKKALALGLALVMALALAACGGGGGGTSDDPNLGKYVGDQVDVLGWEPMSEIYEGENYIQLDADGKGTFCLDDSTTPLTWKLSGTKLTITVEDVDSAAVLEDGVITIEDAFGMGFGMTFVKEGASTAAIAPSGGTAASAENDQVAWWNGDWYGWWGATEGTDSYVDNFSDSVWDCCVRIALDKDGKGILTAWDGDLPLDDAVCEAQVVLTDGLTDVGALEAAGGWFMDSDLAAGAWTVDRDQVYEKTIMLSGHYADDFGAYDYVFYLRPWGDTWDDLAADDADLMPDHYTDWYLPLIEAGKPAPAELDY